MDIKLQVQSKGNSAILSPCGTYRYWLSRTWNPDLPIILFIMLNPSTADAFEDDPTITRCINFAKKWKYGGIDVCNLFAFRSTDPKALLTAEDPIGPENLKVIQSQSNVPYKVVCAWGNGRYVNKLQKRFPDYKPLESLPHTTLYYLDLSEDGTPKHPLYLPGDLDLKPYTPSNHETEHKKQAGYL